MAKRVTLTLEGEMAFRARTGSGHEVTLDADPALGGGNAGMRPTEALLVALGGCGTMDVISILRKMRQDVESYEADVTGQQRPGHPQVYQWIRVTHRLRGPALREDAVRRAIALSMAKYCPVHAMLHESVPVTSAYEISGPDGTVTAGELSAADLEAAAAE